MKDTKIRWSDDSCNPMWGCSKCSPGCDLCYADALCVRLGKSFDPVFRPDALKDLHRWESARIFMNSMSDIHHPAFTRDQVTQVYCSMLDQDRHDYIVLTKRPARMAAFLKGFLAAEGLDVLPGHIIIGTSIELDRYTYRADRLRAVPAETRALSLEPLLGPLPSLNLDGIGWVIVGGESGRSPSHPDFRPMNHDWARDLRDRCAAANIAYYFKQSAAFLPEQGVELDGRRHERFPRCHPRERGTTS